MSSLQSLKPIGKQIRFGLKGILNEISTNIPTEKIILKHDNEDTSNKNPIIATYRQHWGFLMKHWFLFLFFIIFGAFILYGVSLLFSIPLGVGVLMVFLTFVPLMIFGMIRSIVYWIANATVIRQKNLVFHRYYGVFKQSVEVRSIAQIKSFDIVQSGILSYFLNFGDIEVASMISGAATNIVLKNISPVKQAYKTLSDHIDSLDENDEKKENEEEIKI